MAWVWDLPRETEFDADFDYKASAPMDFTEYLSDKPIDASLLPVFRSRSKLSRFKKLHCPPFSASIAIDSTWKTIIEQFVPPSRVQFLPIRLIARGEICDDYMWVIPFDRVTCIDKDKSVVTRKHETPNRTLIFGVHSIVHFPDCLGNLHLARDTQRSSHMVISDELKIALSATGQDSPFYRPEDVETLDSLLRNRRKSH